MSTTVKYNNNTILEFNNDTRVLKTNGAVASSDIIITDNSLEGGEAGKTSQDKYHYVVLENEEYVPILVQEVTLLSNGEYDAQINTAYSPITINVPSKETELIERTITELSYNDLNGIGTIRSHAFNQCTSLASVTFPPTVTTLLANAFSYTGLQEVIIPKTVIEISEYVFQNCQSLKKVEIYGEKTWIAGNSGNYRCRYLFGSCKNLETLIATDCTFGGGNELNGCTSLHDVYMPKASYTDAGTFSGCTSLKRLALPNNTACYTRAFSSCIGLEIIDFGQRTQFFREYIFEKDSSLRTIILRGDTLTPLTNINVFTGTPFAEGGTGGTIYIPKVLYDHLGDGSSLDYKSATNWSTLDGYGTITWAQIEGSEYEYYYADGRSVLQNITQNLTNCTIDNDLAHYHTEFVTQIVPDDGYTTISGVSVSMGGVDITSSVYDAASRTITIDSPDGEIVITATGGV